MNLNLYHPLTIMVCDGVITRQSVIMNMLEMGAIDENNARLARKDEITQYLNTQDATDRIK